MFEVVGSCVCGCIECLGLILYARVELTIHRVECDALRHLTLFGEFLVWSLPIQYFFLRRRLWTSADMYHGRTLLRAARMISRWFSSWWQPEKLHEAMLLPPARHRQSQAITAVTLCIGIQTIIF